MASERPDDASRPAGDVPRSRIRRGAVVTGAAAGMAARTARGRVHRPGRSREHRRAAMGAQQVAAAKALVRILGGMRGAAMKVGQTLSAVDLGLVPHEVRDEVQQVLSELQDRARPVSFDAVRGVIEEDHGRRLAELFADVDETPIATASIGQVHRATLRDGRDVVVKVQYPGIAEAVHADLRNLRMGMKLLNVIAPGVDTKGIADEIRERITEELDYELEASNQRAVARAYEGHPFVVVPRPVTELCRERTVVSGFVAGRRFDEVRGLPAAERDRLGEILVRFYLNGPMRTRLLNGDPHPGNALFLDDGRVAFLDFGFFKRLGAGDVDHVVRSARATLRQDADELFDVAVAVGALPPGGDRRLAEPLLEAYTAIFGWLMEDEPRTIPADVTRGMMDRYLGLRDAEGFGALELPARHFVLIRAVLLLIGQVGQLGATNPWFAIGREWMFDAPATTALGRDEEAWREAGTPLGHA